MIDFNTLRKKAAVQLQDEWNELQDTLWENPESQRLAEAILKLRGMPDDVKFTLSEMLCDTVPASFLRDFKGIFDAHEFIRLPNALDSLITLLRYNILDDGYLRMVKAVIEEDIGDRKIKTSKFFLTTDEDTDPIKLTIRKLEREGTLGFFDPKLISVKRTCFGQVEKFVGMLEVLGGKDHWDGFDFIGEDQLEPLFCFNEEQELLDRPVPLRLIVSDMF